MSLYSHHFDHLPRPSRSLLSVGHEATRAQLPDFATVAELDEFVYRLFVYKLGQVPALFIQMKVAACFISLIVILTILIIARRVYERSFWLVRIIKKSTGSVIVPNAILCFPIIEGLFAATFIALIWLISYTSNEKTMRPFEIPLSLLLPWYPMMSGAIWATWGTYFAIPSQIRSPESESERQSYVQRFLSHAVVTNLLGLCAHLFVFISIFTPAITADVRWNRAQDKADRWRAMYAGQQTFTQPMVQEAQMVWYELLHSMKLCSITFVIWAIWAVSVVSAYHYVCWTLTSAIRQELIKGHRDNHARSIMVAVTTITPQNSFFDKRQQRTQQGLESGILEIHAEEGSRSMHTLSQKSSATPFKPLSLQMVREQEGDYGQEETFDIGLRSLSEPQQFCYLPTKSANSVRLPIGSAITVGQEIGLALERQASPSYVNESQAGRSTSKRWRRFLPSLIMSNSAYESAVENAERSNQSQQKELRKAHNYLLIQFAAIGPAGVCFAGLAIIMATVCFGTSEQPYRGGTMFELALGIVLVLLCWITCLFGGITFVAIALRTYEPVLSNMSVHVPSSRTRTAPSISTVTQ